MSASLVTRSVVTVEEFLARHPWPGGTPPVRVDDVRTYDLDVGAHELWPMISDTSRFNRAMGLTEMNFEEKDGALYGHSRNAGLLQEWVEVPWQWVAERGLVAERRYSRGFATRVVAIYELEARGEQACRLSVYFGFVPRGFWQRWVLGAALKQIMSGYDCLVPELASHLKNARPSPYDFAPPALAPDSRQRLATLKKALVEDGVPERAAEHIVRLVETGDDLDLARIRALPLARKWQLDETEVLLAFLHATRQGLLGLSWDVVCPHCRGVREEVKTLGELPKRGVCEVCDIDFDTASEQTIEVAFHVHPSVRQVTEQFFCSAEPAKKTHIKLQQTLPPGETRTVQTALRPGRYRRRVRGEKQHAYLDVVAGSDQDSLSWGAGVACEGVDRVAPGARLVLENPTTEEQTFVVEEAHWSDDALRPGRLFSFQQFRDLFTEEYLGSDIQLGVGQQTILFTDVVGSTAMYADRGDPGAFVDVKRHFTEIYEVVRQRQGAIVKTIGDAAMAAFVDPVRALDAAHAIQELFHAGRSDLPIRVRASLHAGPCIAVKLNTAIDYFGSTVNAAAKLQACADAGEVAFSKAVLDHPGVRELLERHGAKLDELPFESPALGGSVTVYRWSVSCSAAQQATRASA